MKQEELSFQMIGFLKMFMSIAKGDKQVNMEIESVVVNNEFYNYLVKKGLIKKGDKKFNKYPLKIDNDKYADVWGFNGKGRN